MIGLWRWSLSHEEDDGFGLLRGASCSSNVKIGYLIRGLFEVLFLGLGSDFLR